MGIAPKPQKLKLLQNKKKSTIGFCETLKSLTKKKQKNPEKRQRERQRENIFLFMNVQKMFFLILC
jgi:hypothetical protein